MSVLDTVAELKRRRFPVVLHLAGRLVWPGAEEEVAEGSARSRNRRDRSSAYRPTGRKMRRGFTRRRTFSCTRNTRTPARQCRSRPWPAACRSSARRAAGMPELVGDDAGAIARCAGELGEELLAGRRRRWPMRWSRSWAGGRNIAHAARARAEARFSKKDWLAQHRRVFQSLVAA